MSESDSCQTVSEALDKSIRLRVRGATVRIFTIIVAEVPVEELTREHSRQEEGEEWFEDECEGLVETSKVCQVIKNRIDNSLVSQLFLRAHQHESETKFGFMGALA